MVDVLIVEDVALQSRLIEAFLRDEHVIVGTADNGVEGLELMKQTDPDLIVMDLNMPSMDGVRATAEAKSIDPDVGIVVSSMIVNEEILEEARSAGADAVLTKPYSKADLLDAIHDAVS